MSKFTLYLYFHLESKQVKTTSTLAHAHKHKLLFASIQTSSLNTRDCEQCGKEKAHHNSPLSAGRATPALYLSPPWGRFRASSDVFVIPVFPSLRPLCLRQTQYYCLRRHLQTETVLHDTNVNNHIISYHVKNSIMQIILLQCGRLILSIVDTL